MKLSERGQVTKSAAEVYDEFFVPALFQMWAARVADAAGIQKNQRVLDVACGTGVLAREAAERVGQNGTIVGTDINEGMLTVARRKAPNIEWRQAQAEELPFPAESFDVVVSQFGLMFFENQRRALQEMLRVLRRSGNLTIAVWDSLETFSGYGALTDLVQKLFGTQAAEALRTPFALGDERLIKSLFAEAGMNDVRIQKEEGIARFPSIYAWLFTEVKGWLLADRINDEQFALLVKEAEPIFKPYVTTEGTVELKAPAYIITAFKK